MAIDFDNCLKSWPRCRTTNPCNYHQGWSDGRTGKDNKQSSASYNEGWTEGMIALEESENGEPWSR